MASRNLHQLSLISDSDVSRFSLTVVSALPARFRVEVLAGRLGPAHDLDHILPNGGSERLLDARSRPFSTANRVEMAFASVRLSASWRGMRAPKGPRPFHLN
jgi:hypothetical protein